MYVAMHSWIKLKDLQKMLLGKLSFSAYIISRKQRLRQFAKNKLDPAKKLKIGPKSNMHPFCSKYLKY